jgi:hypothetical protein
MFFFCMAPTIWSDSLCLTRGSFAPCAIRSGFLIAVTFESGERESKNARPSSVR